MSLIVFLAVLFAALLHASWNAMVKSGGDKRDAMLRFTLCQGALGAVLVPFFAVPGPEIWPWIGVSAMIHVGYQLCLAAAYREGDLSRVYPISRGSAPMAVLAITLLWGFEPITRLEALGCAILGLGILTMARGVFASGENRRLLPYAFGAALGTAAYTLVDGFAARAMGDGPGYVAWMMVASSVLYWPVAFVLHKGVAVRAPVREWGISAAAGAASYLGYAIAVWAMTRAPIALVAALRETSILFAVLIGWLVFGDRMDRTKALAAGLIVAGVVLVRL